MKLLHRLSLLQMRLIVEVERLGTIRSASELLCLSASAASKSLLDAERKLGTPIFRRNEPTLRPTADGQRLIRRIAESLAILSEADAELSEELSRSSEEHFVGLSPISGSNLFTLLSVALQQNADDLKVKYHMGYEADLLELLREEKLDLIVLDEPPKNPDGLIFHVISRDELCVIGTKAAPGTVSLRDLQDENWAIPSRRLPKMRGAIDEFFIAETGSAPRNYVESDDIVTSHGLVGNRKYYSIAALKFCLANASLTVFQPHPIIIPKSDHSLVLVYQDTATNAQRYEPVAARLKQTVKMIYENPNALKRLEDFKIEAAR